MPMKMAQWFIGVPCCTFLAVFALMIVVSKTMGDKDGKPTERGMAIFGMLVGVYFSSAITAILMWLGVNFFSAYYGRQFDAFFQVQHRDWDRRQDVGVHRSSGPSPADGEGEWLGSAVRGGGEGGSL
jgi:hypothetical protein